MNRMFAIATVLFAVSATQAGEPKKIEKDFPARLEIRVFRVQDQMVIELPPDLDYSVDGDYVSFVQMDVKKTQIFLNGNSIEIYMAKKNRGGKVPTSVEIRPFQIGPGFMIDPAWRIVYGR